MPRSDDGDENGDGDDKEKGMKDYGDDGGCKTKKCRLNLDKSRQSVGNLDMRRGTLLAEPVGGYVCRLVEAVK